MKRLTSFFLTLPFFCFAQLTPEKEATIDSLREIIETAGHDSIVVNAWEAWAEIIKQSDRQLYYNLQNNIIDNCETTLNDRELPPRGKEKDFYQLALGNAWFNLAQFYYDQSDYKKAADHFTQSLKISEETSYRKGIANALHKIGNIYAMHSDYDTALDHFTRSLQIRTEIKDKHGIASSLHNIGNIYNDQADYVKAIDYYTQSLRMDEALGNKENIAYSLINIGTIFFNQGDYAKAIDYYTRSLKIREEMDDKNGIAFSLNNIGSIYYRQSDFPKALEYFNQSLKIREAIGDKNGIANSLNNIGNIYIQQGEDTKALDYYTWSLKIKEEMGNRAGFAHSLNNIGTIYYNQEDYDQAIDYFTRSLQISKEVGDVRGIVYSLNNLGRIYADQADYKKAIRHGERALRYANQTGQLESAKNAAEALYTSYKETNNPRRALQMYEQYITARDSLESDKNQKEVIRQEYKYQYEKQVLADSIQNAELQKVKDAELAAERAINQQQQQRSWFLLSGLLVALFFGGFIFKQKKQVEAEKEKSENLLLNILPENTAEELKEKGRVAAKSFDSASILFSDFKAFVAISGQMTPEQLVKEVDECFSAFDEIMAKYGIEKIKTIGDAYMAAGGVPTPNNTHASDTLKAALEIQTFMYQYARERKRINQPYFEARIGIHTGPVVAGVVGKKKFQYDLWGDTVNIASRMESAGEVGQVNISEATYELVKDSGAFAFTSRGQVEVKGKGALGMYFVEKRQ